MQRLTITLLAAALCAGCATHFKDGDNTTAEAQPVKILNFQNSVLTPKNGGQLVNSASLRRGDILLSATNGLTSAGIRLLTLSPVSHALLYLGDEQVVEAVGDGIRTRTISEVLAEEAVVVAFRHPGLTHEQSEKMRDFAMRNVGVHYNHIGIVLQAPFSLERRLCELPLIPETVRDFCVRGVAAIQLGASRNDRFFCSQFVLEAYRQAGVPITDADPRLINPADILHMREGDVPSVRIHQALLYVGHLKFPVQAPDSDQRARLAPSGASIGG